MRVPSNMLARQTHRRRAVMRQHVVEMQLHHPVTFGNGRVRPHRAPLETVPCLGQQPGTSLRAAPDHHTGSPAVAHRAVDILEAADIPVHNYRHRHRIDNAANGFPVGRAVIHLAAGAAMNGDHGDPGILGHAGDHRGIQAVIIPAKTHLQRYRHIYRSRHGRQDSPGQRLVTHQRRA